MNARLKICRKSLVEKNLPAFLVSDFYNIGYLSGFFPLSPKEREVFLLITQEEGFLITDGRYINQAKTLKTDFTCLDVTADNNFFQIVASLCQQKKIRNLAFEKGNLTFGEYDKLKKTLKKCRLSPTQNLVEEKRAIKENQEIYFIKTACQITDQTFSHLLGFLKPGITEKEVADEIERFIRKKGAVDLSFDPIVASGFNSAFPHHRTGDRKLKKQDIVLLDFGAKVPASPTGGGNYCSDMTRVVFLGKATEEQKKVYQTVLEAQKRAIDFISHNYHSDMLIDEKESRNKSRSFGLRPQDDITIKASGVESVARFYITSKGYPTIPHSLGHGVGLCEHELPRLSQNSNDLLKPGMVFSVEPGVYLPGKFGVRIEDLVTITKSGPKILTHSPKELIELG